MRREIVQGLEIKVCAAPCHISEPTPSVVTLGLSMGCDWLHARLIGADACGAELLAGEPAAPLLSPLGAVGVLHAAVIKTTPTNKPTTSLR
jgi:hypothetical protein